MAAPKGNKFWQLRSKHGKETLFASPALLWEAACEYFQWSDDNPLIEVEQSKQPAKPFHDKKNDKWIFPDATVKMPRMRPYTMRALCLYLHCNPGYFNDFKERLKKKKGGQDKEFVDVINQIEDTIYVQKFEGAAAGFLKENLIARELGLADKQQVDAKLDANLNAKVSGKVTVVHRQSGVPLGNTPTDGQG